MKLMRVGEAGKEVPAVLDQNGDLRDIRGLVGDLGPGSISEELLQALLQADLSSMPVIEPGGRIGSPVSHCGNFLCIGLNYAKHAAETGAKPPSEPVMFNKAPNCLSGPFDPVLKPAASTKLDWEVELAIVIGRPCLHVSEEEALDHVFGYMICNDISERYFQIERGGQWTKGKSYPSWGPVGPWLVTRDEVGDPQQLSLSLELNGKTVQNSSTDDMIFPVKTIIAYVSGFMQLDPGDVITTGTPQGVGMGMSPQLFLKPGDEMTVRVEKLGMQKQVVAAAS